MKHLLTILFLFMSFSVCKGIGLEEVNHWRKANGLPPFKEDKKLTEFAQMKAEYRARNRLQNGHQGPKHPSGTTEGTGETKRGMGWGWLTCCMECDGEYAGAGVAIGADDNHRYMVLVVKKYNANPLINPHNIKPLDTEHLTPVIPIVEQR